MSGAALTFDLVVRDGAQLDAALATHAHAAEWPRRLVGLALLGLGVHGVILSVAMRSYMPFWNAWADAPWFALPLAYGGGFVGGAALCLPTLYVLTRIAGLEVPLVFVAVQTLRGLARTAALLLGLAPLYLAMVLAVPRGLVDGELVVEVGLLLPFALGLFGLVSLYRSFQRLIPTLPSARAARPGTDIKLTVAWGATFMSVAPLLCVRLADLLVGVG